MKKAISDILWELIPHENKYVITEKDLLDYITNLQQENQELNDSKQWWNNRFNAVQRDYEELQQENKRLKLNIHQLKQKLEAKNKRIKTIKDILNGRSDE